MSDLFSRMNPFRSSSPTKSRTLQPPADRSHPLSKQPRESKDDRPRPLFTTEPLVLDTAPDLRPPISPPGRLRSTSHPSLGSLSSGRRKAAPAPLDLSLSRHKGLPPRSPTAGKSRLKSSISYPIIQHPSPGRHSEEVMSMSAHSAHDPHLTFPRPQTSYTLHTRSQSQHLPNLSAFGLLSGAVAQSRPSSAMDSPLPSSLRGQYLLDTHRSIELDGPVYTPVERSGVSIDGWSSIGLVGQVQDRPQSAAAFVRQPDVPVSAIQTTGIPSAVPLPSSLEGQETRDADRTPQAKSAHTVESTSIGKSGKSKSLSKKPSILRTLAHHPSLSTLRAKRNKDKEPKEQQRHADTPDLVGDIDGSSAEWTSRSNTATPTPNAPGEHGSAGKSLWGSVKRKTKKKEGAMRNSKSVPGLRMSSESSESNWRSSIDIRTPIPTEPVPALPAQYAKSAVPLANAALSALVASSVFDNRPGSSAATECTGTSRETENDGDDKHLTPKKQLRMRRGRSEDLSPAGKLAGKYSSPNRHLSTPPVAQRIKAITPPRHSMPPGTGSSPASGPFWDFRSRDTLPLHLHSRRMSFDSASDAEYNEDDYGDLPSKGMERMGEDGSDGSPARKGKERASRAESPTPTSAATAGSAHTEDGMTPCHTPTLPPPPRNKTTTPHAKRLGSSVPVPPLPTCASNSIRAHATETPTGQGGHRSYDNSVDTPGTIHTFASAADRAESPFEVRFSPMVAKRMSLDAFGTSSLAGVSGTSSAAQSGIGQTGEPAEEVIEELEDEYDDVDRDAEGEDEDLDQDTHSRRSRSRSLSRTPHRRAREYEDPDSDVDMGSEASFDGTSAGGPCGLSNLPYAHNSTGFGALIGTNTLDGWVGTHLTTIKEFPSTTTLDYIPDIPDLETSVSGEKRKSRGGSLVRSPTVPTSLAEASERVEARGLMRSPGIFQGLSDDSLKALAPHVSVQSKSPADMTRSPAVPLGLSERSISMSTDDSDRSIAIEGPSMYQTPNPLRSGAPNEKGRTPWTAQSGMTTFYTPLSYPVSGHQEGDRTMQSEAGEESPCAGREPAKSIAAAEKGVPGEIGDAKSFPFSSASRRLRIKHSSLPPIADEGVNITVQHNLTVAQLEAKLAEAKADRDERDEQVIALKNRLQAIERKQVAEDGRIQLERAVSQKERQVSDGATSIRQMRQALSSNESAYDLLQSAHDNLADRLASAQQAIEMAQAEKMDMEGEIQVLASGTAVMANRIRELEEELSDARAESRSIATERLWNRGELDGLRSDAQSAKRDADRAAADLRTVRSKLDEKDTLISLRESEVTNLKGELQEMKVKVIGLQRGMVEKDKVIEVCRDKIASKQFEVDEMKVALEHVQREKEEAELEREKGQEEMFALRDASDEWDEAREEMRAGMYALRADLALKDQVEGEIATLVSQLDETEAANLILQSQLETARADLEARSGDLSLTSGEVDQLHAELEAANEKVERLEASKARMERDHKRALREAKWDVSETREQVKSANEKLQDALVEREMRSAATKDSASRVATYLDEIERLERDLAIARGQLLLQDNAQTERDAEVHAMKEEIKALKEDRELLNIALESKTMEVTLLQRQLPKAAQGAAKATTPKRKLAASTSRLSVGGKGDVTPTAATAAAGARLAKSAMGPPSAARSSLLTSTSRPSAAHSKRASIASIDEASDTSFASAHSTLGSLWNGPTTSRLTVGPLRGGLKGNRRESSVMGPPSHIPTLANPGRARMQSLGHGRASTTTPAATSGEHGRSTSAVLGDSTKQNRPASAMALMASIPSKIPTFARGPLPRTTGMKDLAATATDTATGAKAAAGKVSGREAGVRRTASVSSFSSVGSGGRI